MSKQLGLVAGAIACIVAGFLVGRTVGRDEGHDMAYRKGYADNTFFHHTCSSPERAGDTIECHRHPLHMGKNENGLPSVKIVVDKDLFERWIRARDDNEEPSTGIDCRINAVGKVDECSFPVG